MTVSGEIVSRPRPDFLGGPIRFIAHYVRLRAPAFGGLLVLVMAAAGCAIAIQYVMKLLVDAMTGRDTGGVWQALWLFLGLIACENVLWRLTGWLGCRVTISAGVDMRLDLYDHLAGQPIRYFTENLAGSLGHRITSSAGNFGALANTVVWRIIPPLTDFLGALIIFLTVDWRMAAAMGGAMLAITGGLIGFGERGRTLHRRYAEEAGRVGGDLVDVIGNMWSVKAFSARNMEWLRLRRHFETEAGAQRMSWMYTEKARVLHDIALWVMAASMLGWAIWLWIAGSVSPGDVVLISTLTFRILHGSRDLALSLVDGVQHIGFIEDTLHVIGQPQTVRDVPDAAPLEPRGGAIEFRNVSFAYGGSANAILDVTVSIPPGQKIGIVGTSGAGKSTFVTLLQRLYDVQAGEILIDGQPIHGVKQDTLRAALAVVPQEISLFHRSVMENIRFGRPGATDGEVRFAAEAACCDSFIAALPHGYDTIVGERGLKLSGGQRQRIGIARAVLKNAPIIILDEATSALDTETEVRIKNSLVRLMSERTVIAVAHRLSTLNSFDRVLVFSGGRIIEDGKPSDLRAQGGLFARMWTLQAEGMSEDAIEAA